MHVRPIATHMRSAGTRPYPDKAVTTAPHRTQRAHRLTHVTPVESSVESRVQSSGPPLRPGLSLTMSLTLHPPLDDLTLPKEEQDCQCL